MGQIRLRLLIVAALAAPDAEPRHFYPDDPILREPPPIPIEKARRRRINEYYDFFRHTFWEPGKQERKQGLIRPAGAVNTLGEVPDSAWYQNRRLSLAELPRGPGENNPPSTDTPWTVLSGKSEGITPGLVIEDARKRQYILKFDPLANPEMASAADAIGSRLFHALGYNTPENYIVEFSPAQLRLSPKAVIRDYRGNDRRLDERDLRDILRKVPRSPKRRYRALASLYIGGDLIGPFRYYGVRKDDPNDVVPHEDRRDLRGLYVFASWVNHTDSKSLNSLDTIVEENGARFVKHYLIDFGAILGSDSFEAKSPRAGNVYLFDFKPAAWQFLSMGMYVPAWMRADYPGLPAAGNFEAEHFEPEKWKSNYPNPAFDNRLPDDTFWAARKVMEFSDERIRAVVAAGQFSDPRAVDWISRTLAKRRDRIGRAYFAGVLPLDGFRVRRGRLEFDDLEVRYGFAPERTYRVEWFRFDNERGTRTPLGGAAGFAVPDALASPDSYACAEIRGPDPAKIVTVYLRRRGSRIDVVGVDRRW